MDGVGDWRAAVLMRAVTDVRFARRAEARAGVAVMFGGWDGVVIEVGCRGGWVWVVIGKVVLVY